MIRNIILTALCFSFTVAGFAQTETPKDKTPEKNPPAAEKKANERPADNKKKEPFDDADVRAMAEKCVRLETEKGSVEIELFPESAPETVRNFLNLVSIGAFDMTTFSRVVPGFIIQGGNIWTNENASNDLKWRAQETVKDEPNQIRHERGILSMARSDEPDSATTNFFILLREADYLDGKFAAFGRVIKGMETVEEINKMPVTEEKPENPVRIKKASVAPCALKDEG